MIFTPQIKGACRYAKRLSFLTSQFKISREANKEFKIYSNWNQETQKSLAQIKKFPKESAQYIQWVKLNLSAEEHAKAIRALEYIDQPGPYSKRYHQYLRDKDRDIEMASSQFFSKLLEQAEAHGKAPKPKKIKILYEDSDFLGAQKYDRDQVQAYLTKEFKRLKIPQDQQSLLRNLLEEYDFKLDETSSFFENLSRFPDNPKALSDMKDFLEWSGSVTLSKRKNMLKKLALKLSSKNPKVQGISKWFDSEKKLAGLRKKRRAQSLEKMSKEKRAYTAAKWHEYSKRLKKCRSKRPSLTRMKINKSFTHFMFGAGYLMMGAAYIPRIKEATQTPEKLKEFSYVLGHDLLMRFLYTFVGVRAVKNTNAGFVSRSISQQKSNSKINVIDSLIYDQVIQKLKRNPNIPNSSILYLKNPENQKILEEILNHYDEQLELQYQRVTSSLSLDERPTKEQYLRVILESDQENPEFAVIDSEDNKVMQDLYCRFVQENPDGIKDNIAFRRFVGNEASSLQAIPRNLLVGAGIMITLCMNSKTPWKGMAIAGAIFSTNSYLHSYFFLKYRKKYACH